MFLLHLCASSRASGDRRAIAVHTFPRGQLDRPSCIQMVLLSRMQSFVYFSVIEQGLVDGWLPLLRSKRWVASPCFFLCHLLSPKYQMRRCMVMASSGRPLHLCTPILPQGCAWMRLDALNTVGAPQAGPAHAAAYPTVCSCNGWQPMDASGP